MENPSIRLADRPAGTKKQSYLAGLIFALATLPNVFLVTPILGHDWPFVREITRLGAVLCNPVVRDVQPASCGPDNSLPDDLLFTAGLGVLYAGILLAFGYAAVLFRSRARDTDLKRFVRGHVLTLIAVVVAFLALRLVCDFGWYCFETTAPGQPGYGEAGRVWMLSALLIVFPVCIPIAWLKA
jgi:hypothetical protein